MYVKVRVTAGARKEICVVQSDTHFLISIREKAERNEANARVIALIAEHFAVSTRSVRIVNGHQSPSKLLSVETA